MRFLLLFALISSHLCLSARQKLQIAVYQDAQYALKWHPEADTVLLSNNSTWNPWMPEGSFGWQLLDEAQLRGMFYCDDDFIRTIDFDQTMVLAVVRYDEAEWNFFPRAAVFDEDGATIHLQYEAVTKTLRPTKKVVSSAIFLITVTETLRRTGITNLRYSLLETQRGPWPQGQSPYPAPVAEHLFPVAYTNGDLRRSLEQKMALLERLQPASDQQNWIPDYVPVENLSLREGLTLSETTYMVVDDSLRWATLFEQQVTRDQWSFVLTEEDFRHYFAIVIAKRDPGYSLGIRDIFWAEQGLRIDTSVETNPDQTQPDLLVILMPRGDYGIMSFRENGRMIDPDSMR